MKTRFATVATAISAAALGAMALPAFAADSAKGQVAVNYRDLDLSTAEGAKELDRRLHKAAKDVCGMNATTTGTRMPSSEARACYKETLQQLQSRFAQVVAVNKERG